MTSPDPCPRCSRWPRLVLAAAMRGTCTGATLAMVNRLLDLF